MLLAQTNRAATIKAADLDGKIDAAEEALAKVDVKAATMQADPQSASMAKAIGADQNLIAALSHAVFAISIELGSGVGFWLVFGHGAPNRRRLETESAASMGLIDRAGAVDLHAVDDTPAEIIERFFLEVARRRFGPRVQSVGVWSAYKVWCAQRGYSPVTHPCLGDWRAGRRIGRRHRLVSRLRTSRGLRQPTARAGAGSAAGAQRGYQGHADQALGSASSFVLKAA